jgi:hypothetical protein
MNSKSLEIAKELRNAGLLATAYGKSPVAGAGFIASATPARSGKELKVYARDNVHVDVYPDKSNKQCIVNVFEEVRILKAKGKGYINSHSTRRNYQKYGATETFYNTVAKETTARLINAIGKVRRSYQLTAAGKEQAVLVGKPLVLGVDEPSQYVEYQETVKILATETCMLMGIDENAHFICAIPHMVYSVREAHRALKPDSIKGKKNIKRQGEFFLVPATSKENNLLKTVPFERTKWVSSDTTGIALEKNSSHYAITGKKIGKKLYVNMQVADTRSARHDPIQLDSWHLVVRNNEVVMPMEKEMANRARYWD